MVVKWPARPSSQEQHTHVKLGLAWQMTGLQLTGMTVAQVVSRGLLVPFVCLQQNVNTICAVQPFALGQINLLRTVCSACNLVHNTNMELSLGSWMLLIV